MASGGKRGAGDRVLESKHVIGLFLLMLLFSGVFFSLGYVMGRNQYDGQVRAANNALGRGEPLWEPKNAGAPKRITDELADSDPSTDSSAPGWANLGKSASSGGEAHLDTPVPPRTTEAVSRPVGSKSKPQAQPVSAHAAVKSNKNAMAVPLIPSGSYVIQVAALLRQDDALAIANGLEKKHYAVYVQTPQKDKYYRVQVGPFRDQKSADVAKKGLEGEGFKAFYVKH
jgi:cell division septation protein DedD